MQLSGYALPRIHLPGTLMNRSVMVYLASRGFGIGNEPSLHPEVRGWAYARGGLALFRGVPSLCTGCVAWVQRQFVRPCRVLGRAMAATSMAQRHRRRATRLRSQGAGGESFGGAPGTCREWRASKMVGRSWSSPGASTMPKNTSPVNPSSNATHLADRHRTWLFPCRAIGSAPFPKPSHGFIAVRCTSLRIPTGR